MLLCVRLVGKPARLGQILPLDPQFYSESGGKVVQSIGVAIRSSLHFAFTSDSCKQIGSSIVSRARPHLRVAGMTDTEPSHALVLPSKLSTGSPASPIPAEGSLRTEVTKRLMKDAADACPCSRDVLLCAGGVGVRMLLGLITTLLY